MMLRDFKFLKRKPKEEETENVPVNMNPGKTASSLSSASQTSDDLSSFFSSSSSRPPLNTILPDHPVQPPNARLEHEPPPMARSKFDRTPTKPKSRPSETLHTPDRFGGGIPKHRRNSEESSGFPIMTPRSTTTTKATGRANSGYSEVNSTQSTPTKSVSKPTVGRVGGGGNGRGGNGGGGFAALYRGIPSSGGGGSTSCAVVNTVEVPHFDLKEDPSFWMDHNVQVLIRVRPLNSMERSMHGYNRCLKQESAQSITWIGQPETRFTFDHVACETIDQETLFRMAGLPMVENCLSGYNSCVFAYGQTGSGKTYTMLGEIDNVELKPSLHRGMTPRIFEFLFARIQAEEESRRDERLKYNCKCSFLEIYNEQITDLLDPSSSNLLLREDVKKGVYVENLSECEVHTVSDILKLLTQGSLNRKVAATNMNRESSRSHCVFTCVIESRWEKDSTTNLRFARLNLVDLAGSERQKSSGAEGERLKEAANINKSLSTLGHVIMILVDVAHGKQRHIPYRDSRLTFLLQDSLGGNSKTMIVANVSPSICCAAETLNTLKFAQRAKLIQNNAVVNEDATGDALALQHQILLLKEELAVLKRQNVFRSLSFSSNANSTLQEQGSASIENTASVDEKQVDAMLGFEPKGIITLSTKQVTLADNPKALDAYNEMLLKQLKSLETTLAGALRREQMAETSINKLEAEIEQLNRLVRQREEDTRSTKMMLRFREDKIQRMESLLGSSLPPDAYLLEDNRSLSEEIQLLRAKVDKNPEVTRFALENIRLLDQLRRFQEFYEEGEREILLDEISNLREQLLQFLNPKSSQHDHPNLYGESQEHPCNKKQTNTLHFELKDAPNELEECRSKLNSCLEENEKLRREVHDLNAMLGNLKYGTRTQKTDGSVKNTKELQMGFQESMWAPYSANSMFREVEGNIKSMDATSFMNHGDEILDLQLEVDILKIILKEEKSSRAEVEERAFCLNRDLELAESKLLFVRKEYEDATHKLREAKSVIAALESQQISAIEEIEDLKKNNDHYARCLSEKEREIMVLKNQSAVMDLSELSNSQVCEDSILRRKLMRMHDSLEKAKRLNMRYQNDLAFQASNEEEMDEVRRQAEAETADVIVCMQEELSILQQHFEDCKLKEKETKQAMLLLQTELQELQERLSLSSEDNKRIHAKIEQKDMELKMFSEEWELLTCEMEEVLSNGQDALADASEQLDLITSSLPQRRIWISEKVGRLTRLISQKDLLIEELGRSLEDANAKRIDMEFMLQSLRGASMVINEVHQQECCEREKETLQLRSRLREKICTVIELERKVKLAEQQAEKASACATVAFVIVNHLSEVNSHNASELKSKDNQLSESVAANLRKEAILVDQAASVEEAEEVIQSLKLELIELRDTCSALQQRLSEKEKHASALEQKLEHLEEIDLMKIGEKLAELSSGVSSVKSSMYIHAEPDRSSQVKEAHGGCMPVDVNDIWTDAGEDLRTDLFRSSSKIAKSSRGSSSDEKSMEFRCFSPDAYDRDNAIILMKKEIESAFESLQEVQVEITKHRVEKEQLLMSEQQYQENMESFGTQLFALQAALSNFEKQLDLKIKAIDQKLQSFEHTLQEALMHWSQTKEILELEIGDARVYAAQKAAEASCIYAKFEEAQDTLKDADIMLNELMLANEKTKLDLEKLKQTENRFTNERDKLIDKVRSLQSIVDLKDQHIHDLEEQYGLELMEAKDQVVQLEVIISQVQATYEESFRSTVYDFHDIRSVILESGKLVQSWIEDIWSEIVVKDCGISVLNLCHLGVLLETVTGLNAENGLLRHGLCASDSIISDLREHNCRTSKELQMFRTLKGKLLVDIKSGFDRISRKEEEAGQVGRSLTSFEKKILDLQLQEELMFQRADQMGSQLTILLEELKLSNRKFNESLSDQDKMLKDKEELLHSQTELFVVDLWTKDVELCVMESQLKEMGLQKAAAEIEYRNCGSFLENVKRELIVSKVDGALKEQELVAKDAEAALLQKKVVEAQGETKTLLCMLKECNLRITETDEVNRALAQDIKLLKEVALSNDELRGELTEIVETKVKLMDQIQGLEAERQTLLNELKINSTTLKKLSCQRDVMQRECIRSEAVTENLKKDVILLQVDQGLKEQMQVVEDGKVAILEKEVEAARQESQDLLLSLRQSNLRITEADEAKRNLEREVLLLKNVALTNDMLKCELNEVMENKERLSSRLQELEGECEKLLRSLKTKETALEISSHHMLLMDQQKQQFEADISRLETLLNKVQKELDIKDLELSKISCMEEENKSLGSEVAKLKSENSLILSDLERKNYDMQLFLNNKNDVDIENFKLHERILFLETMIASLQSHLETKKAEVNHILKFQSEVMADLCSKKRHLEDEKVTLQDEYGSVKQDVHEALTRSDSNTVRCIDSLENACSAGYRLFEAFKEQGFKVIEKLLHEFSGNAKKICQFIDEIESLECHIKEMVSDNMNLNAELLRKDDILKGLLFDLSLLQESASNSKDEKDKVEEMMASLVALEDELVLKSGELDESVAHNQMLEAQLQEKIDTISTLESNFMKENESNLELRSQLEEALGVKCSLEEELTEKKSLIEKLEMGLSQMCNDIGKMSDTIESLRSKLSDLTDERDELNMEINLLKEELEKARALAEENEAIALEAQQIAESRNVHAEEKEAEVKLLERSVEELECTINVLENKVDILKEEAERQRLQREELEEEFLAVNHQMQNVKSADTDLKSYLDAKERDLEQALKKMKILERDMADKDKEIAKCKAHISELNLHAEAQASEYKQKFKELEAIAEQVKPEVHFSQIACSSSNKSEKNVVKSRGSGSPFKCIGLGLAQQMKSEKEEELTVARLHIEELESQAACRQKEIFALNARLAAAESMTHDVIRDLLGVKLDMTNYVSLLDSRQVQKIAENAQLSNLQPLVKDQEVMRLKQQLNEFIKERQGWLEEIDRKQAEMSAAQIALEELRQQEQLLETENEVLKMENANHKKRVMELEGEVKKLSGQQNLQHRIHHHAKIKEENNMLKLQNEDLTAKLRHTEGIIVRFKEELAHYRASGGKRPCISFDEEQRLANKLKETEGDRVQLAQKLLAMCTSILKAAGITKPASEISPDVAEEALEQLKNRITSLEREVQDLMFKNRVSNERIRLSELKSQASPIISSRMDENYSTPRRGQASFLSDFDR